MAINVGSGTTLTFDRFWSWLREHSGCILRAGTDEVWLFDAEELHWHLEEDAKKNPVIQLIAGKRLLSEMVLDVRDALFVQATAEPTEGAEAATVFEVVIGSAETQGEQFSAYHFLLAHPFQDDSGDARGHSGLKH